jgi:hypothetical protein
LRRLLAFSITKLHSAQANWNCVAGASADQVDQHYSDKRHDKRYAHVCLGYVPCPLGYDFGFVQFRFHPGDPSVRDSFLYFENRAPGAGMLCKRTHSELD